MDVNFFAKVDKSKCISCGTCTKYCVTKAIDTGTIADDRKCTICCKCIMFCPTQAISVVPRKEPLRFGIAKEEYSAADIMDKIEMLCSKAHLAPDRLICICTGKTAGEAAAAIVLKNTRSIAELALATGIRCKCGIYCSSAVERLFNAAGIILPENTDSETWVSYPGSSTKTGIWNISDEVAAKYPQYNLKEDRERVKTTTLHNIFFADVAPDLKNHKEE